MEPIDSSANSAHCAQFSTAMDATSTPTTMAARADEDQIELRVDERQLGAKQNGATNHPRPPSSMETP